MSDERPRSLLICDYCNVSVDIQPESYSANKARKRKAVEAFDELIDQECPHCGRLLFKDYEKSTVGR